MWKLATGISVGVVVAVSASAQGQVYVVPGDFPTIQSAIDAVPAGTPWLVSVLPGSYTGPVDLSGKDVVVRGAGPGLTVIEGTGGATSSVVRMMSGEPATAALERVTVRGGLTGSPYPGFPSALVGGGIMIFQSSAAVRECVVEANISGSGGGIYVAHATPVIDRCLVRNNLAGSGGGGIQFLESPGQIVDTIVELNESTNVGGGLVLGFSQPVLLRCTVRGNRSQNAGGGVWWKSLGDSDASLRLQDCSVVDNASKTSAGGIAVVDNIVVPSLELHGTTVCGNGPIPNILGRWEDLGGNSVCGCTADLTLDGTVNGADVAIILSEWGACAGACPPDIDGDGLVSGSDLSIALSQWGDCGD